MITAGKEKRFQSLTQVALVKMKDRFLHRCQRRLFSWEAPCGVRGRLPLWAFGSMILWTAMEF